MASYNEFASTYPYVLRLWFSIILFLIGGSVRVLSIHDVELALDLGDQIVEHVGLGMARFRITSAIESGIKATPQHY